MKQIDKTKNRVLFESYDKYYDRLYLEFKEGDRTWVGATNAAKAMEVTPGLFRSYFKKIKDDLVSKDYPIGYAIAVAYNISRKHFRKLKNKIKNRRKKRK